MEKSVPGVTPSSLERDRQSVTIGIVSELYNPDAKFLWLNIDRSPSVLCVLALI